MMHLLLRRAQVFLAPTPGTAWFLKPAERRWLQQRQDDSHAAAMKRTHGQNSSMVSGLTNWRLWYLGIVRAPLALCSLLTPLPLEHARTEIVLFEHADVVLGRVQHLRARPRSRVSVHSSCCFLLHVFHLGECARAAACVLDRRLLLTCRVVMSAEVSSGIC